MKKQFKKYTDQRVRAIFRTLDIVGTYTAFQALWRMTEHSAIDTEDIVKLGVEYSIDADFIRFKLAEIRDMNPSKRGAGNHGRQSKIIGFRAPMQLHDDLDNMVEILGHDSRSLTVIYLLNFAISRIREDMRRLDNAFNATADLVHALESVEVEQ